MANNKLRIAVIGAGYMGSLHAEKFAKCSDAVLIAVADPDAERAQALARDLSCRAVSDYREVLGSIDAACVAVPTPQHHKIAGDCLAAGLHVLVEKPLACTLAEADRLMAQAAKRGVVLQVGHLQRYNPAFRALAAQPGRPLYIDIERLAPFRARGSDVDVVLDLMIHDLDLVLALARAPVTDVSACGFRVLTDGIDIANARIEFQDACVASISASRVSQSALRKFRVFWPDLYVSADLKAQRLRFVRGGAGGIEDREETFAPADELQSQAEAFIAAIRGRDASGAQGQDGREAMALALRISKLVQARLERHAEAVA